MCEICVLPVRNSPNTSVIAMLSMPPPSSLLQRAAHSNTHICSVYKASSRHKHLQQGVLLLQYTNVYCNSNTLYRQNIQTIIFKRREKQHTDRQTSLQWQCDASFTDLFVKCVTKTELRLNIHLTTFLPSVTCQLSLLHCYSILVACQ